MPVPPPGPVEEEIRRRLADRPWLSFAEYMQTALYLPGQGYYTRPQATTGPAGDFATSADVSPDFGRRLAVQAAEVWDSLGRGPWRIVEMGPGRGLMAVDLLDGLTRHAPRARAALAELILVEVSPSLAARQRERLEAVDPGVPLRWVCGLEELEEGAVTGVIVANEVLDALPVHLLVRRDDGLFEQGVEQGPQGTLRLADGPLSDHRLAGLAARFGLCSAPGYQGEVCLELEPLLGEVARVLRRGAVLIVDYGHPASRLADRAHAAGTLLGYFRHRVVDDPLARPGEMDLTAHVNWDHLSAAAGAAGLAWAGRTTQDRFLLALGILEDLVLPGPEEEISAEEANRRLAARALVLPGLGGGKRFEVVGLVKGLPPALRGFRDPLPQCR